MRGIVRSIAKGYILRAAPRLEKCRRDALESQDKLFKHLIEQGRSTDYGKRHGLGQVKNQAQLARAMPAVTYADFFPEIERMLLGESNVSWPGKPGFFVVSSGTSQSSEKYIPLYKPFLLNNHQAAGREFLCNYLTLHPDSKLLDGSCILLGGCLRESKYSVQCGDISALGIDNASFWVHKVLSKIPKRLLLMERWTEKSEAISRVLIRGKLSALAGVPTWVLITIKRMLEISGKSSLSELFPDFEVYFHGGVCFAPHLATFQEDI